MRRSLPLSKLMLILVFGAGFAQAADAPLPLQPGTYVLASYKPCEEVALAGVISFDGNSFVGPHDSDCQTTILDQQASTYRVAIRCKALGDGTPTPPRDSFARVRIDSSTSFSMIDGADETPFVLCPEFH